MKPFLAVFAAFAGLTLAISAFGAESDGFAVSRLGPVWSWIDPKADSLYDLAANPGFLRLSVAGRNHDLNQHTAYNAPRLLQSAGGDFSIETKLSCEPRNRLQGAGLLIWQDDNNFLKLTIQYSDNGLEVNLSGETADVLRDYASEAYEGGEVWLRLERRQTVVSAYYSADGREWTPLAQVEFAANANVSAGLILLNEYQDRGLTADFDYFRIHSL